MKRLLLLISFVLAAMPLMAGCGNSEDPAAASSTTVGETGGRKAVNPETGDRG
jgi:ABC-type Fe3+-citrate transport system substrate-binding protein